MTNDEVRAALRIFMAEHKLGERPWSEKSGLGGATLGQFMRGVAKSITIEKLDALAKGAGVDVFDMLGAGAAKPPASMVQVKWLKLDVQFGGQVLVQDDRSRPRMLLPRALIEEHALGEVENVRVVEIHESLDPVVRVGDIAAIDRSRTHPRMHSGHYYVWDGHVASVRNLQPLAQDRLRVFAEGGALDVSSQDFKVIGKVFWRGGAIEDRSGSSITRNSRR